MKYSAQAMNNNENNLPTSLLIPKTSPLANTKLRFAIRAIIIPERIGPKTPKIPTILPNKNAIHSTRHVEIK